MESQYDLIIVGTGFAASFFLMRYLEHAPATERILVLERGGSDSKPWQLQNRRTSSIAPEQVFHNATPAKDWYTSPGFGGNSKCWLGGTTRMMPGDFQLHSRYGVGLDWPMSYDDLEKHYGVVEQIMQVSGPSDSPMPRSSPFPLPPHRFSDPDTLLKRNVRTVYLGNGLYPTETRAKEYGLAKADLAKLFYAGLSVALRVTPRPAAPEQRIERQGSR